MNTTLEISDAKTTWDSLGFQQLSSVGKRQRARETGRPGLFRVRIGIVIFAIFILRGGSPVYGDVITDWNAIMQDTVSISADPFLAIRSAAITQVAVFEAVNAIVREYHPYLGTITAPRGASPDAAAIAAAYRCLVTLHPARAQALDAFRATSLAAIPDGSAKLDGIAVGEAAANAILAQRANDGTDAVVPYTPGTGPGDWRPTPPDFTPAFRPGLGNILTFGIENGAQFRLGPPPDLHSRKYARDYDEVKRIGEVNGTARTPDRTVVARFYGVAEPVPIYNPAARQVSAAQDKTLSQNARIFALINIAIFDAAVAVFDTKYHYNFWRPVTAIREGDKDKNHRTDPDPNWLSLVFTLPFPSYPSGHAGFGGATRYILEHVFGTDGHSITLTHPLLPGTVLHYSSWKKLTDDIDDARIYGGVHYRFDQEAGALQGRRVGAYILRHELRPIQDRSATASANMNRRRHNAVRGRH